MTEAFTARIMIFIEQFRARWSWSIGVLESWLFMSSSSEVPTSSILRIPSPRRFIPGCGRHLQEWSLYVFAAVARSGFIEQFRARWPWSIGVLEFWLSMSSSSEVPTSSILRIPSLRRFVPGCGRHLQEWSLYVFAAVARRDGDETSRGRNPENGRRRDFGRRRHRQSEFQHTDRPRPSSPQLFNKDHNAGRESLSVSIRVVSTMMPGVLLWLIVDRTYL